MWSGLTNPFPNGANVEVWDWISNTTLYWAWDNLSILWSIQAMLATGAQLVSPSITPQMPQQIYLAISLIPQLLYVFPFRFAVWNFNFSTQMAPNRKKFNMNPSIGLSRCVHSVVCMVVWVCQLINAYSQLNYIENQWKVSHEIALLIICVDFTAIRRHGIYWFESCNE